MSTISKTALGRLRKLSAETWSAYYSVRGLALAVGRSYKAGGSSLYAREQAIGMALEARRDAWVTQRRLEAAESFNVVPHGGRWSATAMRRNGYA